MIRQELITEVEQIVKQYLELMEEASAEGF